MRYKRQIKLLKCENCKYSDIPKFFIVRTNYPFGHKSKGRTTIICPNCKKLMQKQNDKREY